MPHFYFDVRRGNVVEPDHDGVFLSSVMIARAEAARTAVDMVNDRVSEDMADFVIAVRDERGEPLFEVEALVQVREHERRS